MPRERAERNPYAPPAEDAPPAAGAPPAEDVAPDAAAAAPRAKGDAAWAASTYFAEGLPFSLVHKVSSEYLVNANVSAEIIGLTSLAHLPWNFKFLWAPLVDRFGTTKRWMVAAQIAIAACTLFLAAFAATFVPWAFGIGLIAIAFFAATNDIAIDGYYMKRLDARRQSALAGVRVGGYRVAMMVGGGLIVTLGGLYGFPIAFGVAAAMLALLGISHGLFLAPDGAAAPGTSIRKVVSSAARTFFSQRGVVIAVVVLLTYRAGDAMMFAMNSKFLAELGLDTTTRGLVNGTLGTIASIGGSLAGGAMIARYSFTKMFVPITALQAGAILLYAGLAALHPPFLVVAAVVIVEQFAAGVGTAAFVVFIMRICGGEQKATQYAFASSAMSLAMAGAGAVSGFLFTRLGSTQFFLLSFAAALPGLFASLFVKLAPEPKTV